jgi:sacsin
VLANYLEGTIALRELIQNADNAGPSRVHFCLDRPTHGYRSLLAQTLARCQGTARLAHNDTVLTDDDFASISRIGDSKFVSQAWKTRRFGYWFLPTISQYVVNANLASSCNLQSKLYY